MKRPTSCVDDIDGTSNRCRKGTERVSRPSIARLKGDQRLRIVDFRFATRTLQSQWPGTRVTLRQSTVAAQRFSHEAERWRLFYIITMVGNKRVPRVIDRWAPRVAIRQGFHVGLMPRPCMRPWPTKVLKQLTWSPTSRSCTP